jgi:uncharacterized DUF497 family protein
MDSKLQHLTYRVRRLTEFYMPIRVISARNQHRKERLVYAKAN